MLVRIPVMSKIAILLAPLYHTFSPEEYRPYCLNYMNSEGELASTRFTYNRLGQNDRSHYQQISGRRSSRNDQTFDKDGRIVRKDRVYNDGERTMETFFYDKKGRLVEEKFESSKGAAGTARYEYDDSGNAHRMVCEGYKGWLNGVIEFEFDSHSRRKSAAILKDGQPAGTITYEYDGNSNLVHEHWEIGSWNQTLRYAYEDLSE